MDWLQWQQKQCLNEIILRFHTMHDKHSKLATRKAIRTGGIIHNIVIARKIVAFARLPRIIKLFGVY